MPMNQKRAVAASGIRGIVSNMTTQQKVAQMIMPALRTWGSGDDAVSATTLSDEQKAVLMKYSFGGVIIFGQNIEEAGQTTQLISSMLWALISICDEYYGDRCRLEKICRKYDVPITIQDYQPK